MSDRSGSSEFDARTYDELSIRQEYDEVLDYDDTERSRRPTRQRTLTERGRVERLRGLKRDATTALTAVTKCKNELSRLLHESNTDNLHLIKSCFSRYLDLCFSYEKSVELCSGEMESAQELHAYTVQAKERSQSMKEFRIQVQEFIRNQERELVEEIEHDSVSNRGSQHIRRSKDGNSVVSHVSSTKSARTFEKAKLAELLAERSLMGAAQKVKELQLDIAIAKVQARERVFASAEDDEIEQTAVKGVFNASEQLSRLTFQDADSRKHTLPLHTATFKSEPHHSDYVSYPGSSGNYSRQLPTSTPEHVTMDQGANTSNCLADVHKQMTNAMLLPQPEVPKFKGDPMEFGTFIMSFDTRIVPHTSSDADRLYYLDQQLEGEAKDLISGCLYIEPTEGYKTARQMLQKEYGDPYCVSRAYLKKVLSWPMIRNDDNLGLKQFSVLLFRCYHVMHSISHMSVLNHAPNLQAIVQKLPFTLQNKWRDRVTKLRMDGHQAVDFKALVDFIDFAAKSANEPIFGKDALNESFRRRNEGNRKGNQSSRRQEFSSFAARVNGNEQKSGKRPVDNDKQTLQHLACYFCKKQHDIDDCQSFRQKSLAERRAYLRDNNRCFSCYGTNHTSKGCLQRRFCTVCEKRHPTALHDYNYKPVDASTLNGKVFSGSSSQDTSKETVCNVTGTGIGETVLQPIIPVKVKQKGQDKVIVTYAFLDNGSTGCFITNRLKQKLDARAVKTTLKLTTMNGTEVIDTDVVNDLIVTDLSDEHPTTLPKTFCRDMMPVDHSHIPQRQLLKKWPHFEDKADKLPHYQPNLEIGLLLGINCSIAHQPLEVMSDKTSDLFAVRYRHGWTVNGPIQMKHNKENNTVVCNNILVRPVTRANECMSETVLKMFEQDFSEHDQGKSPGEKGYSVEDESFMKIINSQHHFIDGHFQVPLPFKKPDQTMPNIRDLAVKRALGQRKKMLRDDKYYKDYVAFIDSLLQKGYARKVPPDDLISQPGGIWYLPHHGIYHPKKPSKIRVVFDCSAKCKGLCLNDVLLQGPDLANSLVGVLHRFRTSRIAFMGDIEAMFHQVQVPIEHQNFLRFVWWPDGNLDTDLEEYCMTVHVFGSVSSPSIANFAVRATAEKAEAKYDESVTETLRRNCYVDDCLKSVDTEDDAIKLIKDLQSASQEGGFKLAKFVSNSKKVVQSISLEDRSKDMQAIDIDCDKLPVERALGLQWHTESDTFQYAVALPDNPSTRRGILSTVSSLYDPLGLVSPVLLPARKIIQNLCKDKTLDWDDIVDEDYQRQWKQWLENLQSLKSLQIERCMRPSFFGDIVSKQLYVFSDASTSGYGCSAYFRVSDDCNTIHTVLLMGKSRLAPLKVQSIPRLELTAATVAVRIGRQLLCELDIDSEDITYFTDSTTVLHYIKSEHRRFPVFVVNRVKLIRDFSNPQQWFYVESNQNPADITSRGCSCETLLKSSIWFEGPQFLRLPHSEWPSQSEETSYSNDHIEAEENVAVVNIQQAQMSSSCNGMTKLINHYSSWYRLKRAITIYKRLVKILYQRRMKSQTKPQRTDQKFTVAELKEAEMSIVKFVQLEHYRSEIRALQKSKFVTRDSGIHKLNPIFHNGLLRVGGRLSRANISEDMKHPILIPCSSHISTLIIREIHEKLGHTGRSHVLSTLREHYWITKANSTIRSIINKCTTCRRYKMQTSNQLMSDLPEKTVNPAPPFAYCGVDFFGPHTVKEGRKCVKRYGALFTCFTSRAIHIETANSLSTDSFIQALCRFIARRGPVMEIHCDNGTNFTGAAKELGQSIQEMNQSRVHEYLLKHDISWKFNPPSASHMGGVWERLIRSVRDILNPLLREFGDRIDDESYRTLLTEVEAVVNSRPLTTPSDDPLDLQPLTPNHLLMVKKQVFIPPPGEFQKNDVYMRQRWRCVQHLTNLFWTRWKNEYLLTLQKRQKWNVPKRNFKMGDIVLIKDDSLPRTYWSMARIVETEPDQQGYVRTVSVKTQGSTLRRPIHKLVLLLANNQ